jgi:hypothetical protein
VVPFEWEWSLCSGNYHPNQELSLYKLLSFSERYKKRPRRCPMTMHSEHRGYRTDSVVEQLGLVAIVVVGMAGFAVWLYLLW